MNSKQKIKKVQSDYKEKFFSKNMNVDTYSKKDHFEKACKISDRTTEALDHFYLLYQGFGKPGSPTHVMQDLLRSMLLFASSGLDVFLKQLVKDVLPEIIESSNESKREFVKYIERRIKNKNSIRLLSQNESRDKNSLDYSFIANVFGTKKPNKYLLDEYKKHLCDSSLQSSDEVLRIAGAFALMPEQILGTLKVDDLTNIFKERNKISHEMDIDFNKTTKSNTRKRQKQATIKQCKNIILIMQNFLKAIDNTLKL